MARSFQNSANGYTVKAGAGDVILAMLFGPIYFVFTGLWAAAIGEFLLGIAFLAAFGESGMVLVIPMWLIVGAFAISLKSQRYLKMGWREV